MTALRGVRVLELSYLLPGPFATLILADMGAEVIKVEDPNGDGMRLQPIRAPFDALNRGKKSVVLDLKTPGGIESLRKLCATADVFVQGYRPGVLERLGVGISVLRKDFPRLIVCSITGYGLTGPLSQRAGHDANYLSRAGVLGMMRHSPGIPPVQIADIAGGAYPAVMQILAALYARDRSGQGCLIDVSMSDNSYALLGVPRAIEAATKTDMSAGAYFLCGAMPCYDVYPCKDRRGYVSVGCIEKKFWVAFIDALGLPKDLHSQGQVTGPKAEKVKQQIREAIASKTREEWAEFFASRDVMCEIVATPTEAAADPHFRERMPPVMVGGVPLIPTPLCMDGGLVKFRAEPGPKLGHDTQAVLSKL